MSMLGIGLHGAGWSKHGFTPMAMVVMMMMMMIRAFN